MSQDPVPPAGSLLQAIMDYPSAQVIHAAARLGLADLLADGPRSVEDLATATGTHAPSLARLVRALAALGVVAEADGGRVELTPLGATLRADVHGRSGTLSFSSRGTGTGARGAGSSTACGPGSRPSTASSG